MNASVHPRIVKLVTKIAKIIIIKLNKRKVVKSCDENTSKIILFFN